MNKLRFKLYFSQINFQLFQLHLVVNWIRVFILAVGTVEMTAEFSQHQVDCVGRYRCGALRVLEERTGPHQVKRTSKKFKFNYDIRWRRHHPSLVHTCKLRCLFQLWHLISFRRSHARKVKSCKCTRWQTSAKCGCIRHPQKRRTLKRVARSLSCRHVMTLSLYFAWECPLDRTAVDSSKPRSSRWHLARPRRMYLDRWMNLSPSVCSCDIRKPILWICGHFYILISSNLTLFYE